MEGGSKGARTGGSNGGHYFIDLMDFLNKMQQTTVVQLDQFIFYIFLKVHTKLGDL